MRRTPRLVLCLATVSLLVTLLPFLGEECHTTARAAIPLEQGDILFADLTPLALACGAIPISGYSNDHVALYAGKGYVWESAPYFPRLPRWWGVHRTPLLLFRLIYTNWTVAKLTATPAERAAMVQFCAGQHKDHYQWSYPTEPSYQTCFVNPLVDAEPPLEPGTPLYEKYATAWSVNFTTHFHCAELVWAAWIHGAQIDVDASPVPEQGWLGWEQSVYNYIVYGEQLRDGCKALGTIYNYKTGEPEPYS